MTEIEKIKKRYGEETAHLCRSMFPTVLDKDEDILYNILEKSISFRISFIGRVDPKEQTRGRWDR